MTVNVALTEVAEFIRSKNAGPFRITLDIVFRDRLVYEAVRDSAVLTPASIAQLYGIDEERITDFVAFDPGKAIKVTLRRSVSAGSSGDTDVYGAQQHAPLLALRVDVPEQLLPDGG